VRLFPRPVRRSRFGAFGLALAIALAAAACAARLSPIRIEGTPANLSQLVGTWTGEYVSDTSGEAGGSIYFRLQAEEARASGDVMMTRRGARTAYELYDPEHGIGRSLGAAQSLSIEFVQARDGSVNGELDPYWDFDRACEAHTVFHGSIRGRVIEGTYETTFKGPYRLRTGKWRVVKAETVIK